MKYRLLFAGKKYKISYIRLHKSFISLPNSMVVTCIEK